MVPPQRLPVLFVGHGNPMNAVRDNRWSRGFQQLGKDLPRPRAILAVSAHWYVPGTFLTGNHDPQTIHDFGGFPPELYQIQYAAPGEPGLAEQVAHLLHPWHASVRSDWGLDHGTWSVLRHMFPAADIPTVQLSIDARLGAAQHHAIGHALAPLRDDGILILASGNLVHNLRSAFHKMQTGDTTLEPWAADFDERSADALVAHDNDRLQRALQDDTGRMAHPSPDHYLPILYATGAAGKDEVAFPLEGFDMGTVSMRTVRFG